MPLMVAGRKGFAGQLAVPALSGKFMRTEQFRSPPFSTANTVITGTTRDSTGVALAGCSVDLFQTGGDRITRSTVSDASGNYIFNNPGSGPFYIVAYKAGATDVFGTTVNTLIAQ